MSNSVKVIVAVVIIVLAVVLYVVRSGDSTPVTQRTDFNTRLKCLDCGHDFGAVLQLKDEPPFPCPKCGKTEAWYLWKCNECGALFVPEPVGTPPRQPGINSCPECGSRSAGHAPVED